MGPPSPLAISSSSVQRLLKEEATYHAELAQQEAKVRMLEEKEAQGGSEDDGNAEFVLKQQRTAVEQTRAVFAPLRQRIADAVAKLEEQIALSDDTGAHSADLASAKAVLAQAKKA